jgi:RNA polymerase sigma-70 factor (ECF subfamily)
LVFTEGHTATSGVADRPDLVAEAIRLARLVTELMPDEAEALGLLALLLLTDARRPARVADGSLIPLAEQDRSRWDAAAIAEGHELVRRCLRRGAPGVYQIQAAINAVHTDAPSPAATDWRQILALYDQLAVLDPGPVVALNRAVALAEVEGPGPALAVVEGLDLPHHHLREAVRADLLTRLDRPTEARAALDAALSGTANPGERALLTRRREALA